MRKIIVLVLSLMFLLILHSEVSATSGGTTIDLMDTNPPASGTGWTFANTVYTIQDGANVTVTSNNSLNGFTIEIAENATATLTLNNAIIGLGNNPLPDGVSALSLLPGANLTIIPLQLSDLASGANAAGIQVPVGTTLTINLTTYGGTLFASGGGVGTGAGGGAGIGGSAGQSAGTINIISDYNTVNYQVTAGGGMYAAGIGGGAGADGGTVNINGGYVVANGGGWGSAGIGGGANPVSTATSTGSSGSGGNTTITNANIRANGSGNVSVQGIGGGAGIGGAGANNSTVGSNVTSGASGNTTIYGNVTGTISGGAVTHLAGTTADSYGAAAIGSGGQGRAGAVGEAALTPGVSTIDFNPVYNNVPTALSLQCGFSIYANSPFAGYGGGNNPANFAGMQMVPNAPINLAYTKLASGDIYLSWQNGGFVNPIPSNLVVASYLIYADGVLVGESTTTNYTLTNLTHGQIFTVRAKTNYSGIGMQALVVFNDIAITSIATKSVVNGIGGTFQVTAIGQPTITFSLSNEPNGVVIDNATGLLTTSPNVPVGTYPFQITATNGLLSDTQTFTLVVTPAPVPVTITSSNDISIIHGTSGTFHVTATGTTPITYSLINAPNGVSINANTGYIQINGTVPVGVYVFNINAENIVNKDTHVFTLSILTTLVPPTITSKNNASFVNDIGGTFQVTASGTLPFTYGLIGAPDGVSINAVNGRLTVAGSVPVDTYKFQVTVSNNPTASQDFTLIMTEEHVPPAIHSDEDTSVVEGVGGTFQVVSSGTTPIYYTLTDAPDGVTIGRLNGRMQISATVPSGKYTFTITATNDVGKATQVFTLVVTDGDSDADDVPRTDGNNYELLWFALSIFSLNFIGIVLITKRKRTDLNN